MTLIRVPQHETNERSIPSDEWLRDHLSNEEPQCTSYALQNPASETAVFMAMVGRRDEIVVSDDDYPDFVNAAFNEGTISESKRDYLLSL